jgi:hypothetical protein
MRKFIIVATIIALMFLCIQSYRFYNVNTNAFWGYATASIWCFSSLLKDLAND